MQQDRPYHNENITQALAWNPNALVNKFILKPVYWLIPIAIWSLVVLFSYTHNSAQIKENIEEMAANKGRFVFTMIQDIRLWNARHDGVYVARTQDTPSNPYLIDDEKDVVTNFGQNLTKVNPAYMTRQLAQVIRENSDTSIHITSLDPINPDNLADSWETIALQKFEDRAREHYSFISTGTDTQFRYMAPLITQQACIGCHEDQGYEIGDIRGGISISFDAFPFLDARNSQLASQRLLHFVTWLLLCGLSLLALSSLRHHLAMLLTAHTEQEAIVAMRTHDLRVESKKRHEAQAQFGRFIDASAEGIIALDENGICTFANLKAAHLFEKDSYANLVGRAFDDLSQHHCHEANAATFNPIMQAVKGGHELSSDTEFFRRSSGEPFPVEYFVAPVFEEDTQIGAVLTFSDISKRKERESKLLKLSTAVEESPASTIITDFTGKIEYINRRFSEATGYDKEEIIGQNPRLLKSGYTPPDVYKDMWDTLRAGKNWRGELLNKKKDGSLFWEETLISPIKDTFDKITHFVAVKRDITGYKTEMDEAWRQANYDSLTRLPNRNLFEDRLETAVSLAQRENRILGLLFIDLDGFKAINDNFGHEAGDFVLKTTAKRLQLCLRHSDTAARLGGDEFVIIVQDAHSIDAIENVAKKIIRETAQQISFEENTFNISASIGIAIMPRDANSAKNLVRFADVAMYVAKQRGKNDFFHYNDFAKTQSHI
jgi:diguanylate cyclase (GGDEF)-like protein/PAS domain S-box-containing protein